MDRHTEAEAHVVRFCGVAGLPDESNFGTGQDWTWLRDGEGKPVEGLPNPDRQYGFRRYEWSDGSAIVTSDKEWFFGFHRCWIDDQEVVFAITDSGENIPAEFTNPSTLSMGDEKRRPASGPPARREFSRTGTKPAEVPEVPSASTEEGPGTEGSGDSAVGEERAETGPAEDADHAPVEEKPIPAENRDALTEVLASFDPPVEASPETALATAGQTGKADEDLPNDPDIETALGLPETMTDRDLLIYASIEFGRLWEAERRNDTESFRKRASRIRSILDCREQ